MFVYKSPDRMMRGRRRVPRWTYALLDGASSRVALLAQDGMAAAIAYALLVAIAPLALIGNALWIDADASATPPQLGGLALVLFAVGCVPLLLRTARAFELVFEAPALETTVPLALARQAAGGLAWLGVAIVLGAGLCGRVGWERLGLASSIARWDETTFDATALVALGLCFAVLIQSLAPTRWTRGDLLQGAVVASVPTFAALAISRLAIAAVSGLTLFVERGAILVVVLALPRLTAWALLLGAAVVAERHARVDEAAREQRALAALRA